VLVVEDDDAIAEPLARALQRDGNDVVRAADGSAALEQAGGQAFDLVLLDLGLPDMDGLALCRELHRDDPDLPVLMLTARSEELDVIVGLDAGADDYVTKPFRMGELLARVRARVRKQAEENLAAQDVTIDVAARRVRRRDTEVELTAKEFDLLTLLVRHAGAVVPRERIMEAVWDVNWFGSTRTLDVHVSALRRKLRDDPARARYITTVRGVGFRFERA
jgi:DNA-binding response OmpR family regulator